MAPVEEAYGYVLEGYRRALMVIGLPDREIEDLRACFRAAAEIAAVPTLDVLHPATPAEGEAPGRCERCERELPPVGSDQFGREVQIAEDEDGTSHAICTGCLKPVELCRIAEAGLVVDLDGAA
jgi:hypothetical protein